MLQTGKFGDPTKIYSHQSQGVISRFFQSLRFKFGMIGYRIIIFLSNHPFLLRWYFTGLRRTLAVHVGRSRVTLTRHPDIKDVLERNGDFLLSEVTNDKMLGGDFLLNMDWPEQHGRERAALESIFWKEDLRRIRELVQAKTAQLVEHARAVRGDRKELNVASGFAEQVAEEIIAKFFGIPVTPQVSTWLRELASAIVVTPPEGSLQRLGADSAASQLAVLLQHEIDTRRAKLKKKGKNVPPAQSDDVLTRLVKKSCDHNAPAWLDEEWCRRFIFGLIVTGTATITRASTHAFDRLLAHPHAFVLAQGVADDLTKAREQLAELAGQLNPDPESKRLAGLNTAHAQALLQQYVYEALRFRPMLPLLARICPREAVVGTIDREVRKAPAERLVLTPPIAAMFDPAVFHRPRQFRSDRSLDGYLHFGFGPHQCFGRHIADVQIIELIRELLLLQNVRRKGFLAGRVKYEGPAATALHISFD